MKFSMGEQGDCWKAQIIGVLVLEGDTLTFIGSFCIENGLQFAEIFRIILALWLVLKARR